MRAIPISINNRQCPSARAAARYIVAEEQLLGNERKENTIVKELKRCYPKNGGHSWLMYGRWLVKCGIADTAAERSEGEDSMKQEESKDG